LSRKIKILHILWSGGIGGTEEYILTLIKNIDYSKYEISLCFLSSKGAIFEETSKMDNVDVAFIGVRNGFDITGAIKFARYLNGREIDIVHSHMRNFLSTAVMLIFAFRVPKILTHHIGPVDVRIFKKNNLFYRFFAGFFRQIIAISGLVKDNLVHDFAVKRADKITVIHNCIDLEKFKSTGIVPSDLQCIKRPDRYIFGFVGRMEHYKRPLLFIEIANELLRRDKRFIFIMVGDGTKLEECRKMVRECGIDEYVHLLGFRRDIQDILRMFDALLFTSYGEGFGIVLLEAMAAKLPVFAINDGAVPEIISHKVNGILLDTTDPKRIAENILEDIQNAKLMDQIRDQCIKDVQSRFAIQICVKRLDDVYRKCLS